MVDFEHFRQLAPTLTTIVHESIAPWFKATEKFRNLSDNTISRGATEILHGELVRTKLIRRTGSQAAVYELGDPGATTSFRMNRARAAGPRYDIQGLTPTLNEISKDSVVEVMVMWVHEKGGTFDIWACEPVESLGGEAGTQKARFKKDANGNRWKTSERLVSIDLEASANLETMKAEPVQVDVALPLGGATIVAETDKKRVEG